MAKRSLAVAVAVRVAGSAPESRPTPAASDGRADAPTLVHPTAYVGTMSSLGMAH